MTPRIKTGAVLREAMFAALVLALFFLNFGHQPAFAHAGVENPASSWCGDPAMPVPLGHAPCHVCRIGNGADLPPPPAAMEPVIFAATAVFYAAPDIPDAVASSVLGPQPRGPPGAV